MDYCHTSPHVDEPLFAKSPDLEKAEVGQPASSAVSARSARAAVKGTMTTVNDPWTMVSSYVRIFFVCALFING